jgi:nitroreductase
MINSTELESIAVKEARTSYPVHEFIRNRWSARSFAERPIAQDELFTLLEAASWSASSMNEQPWVYLYAHRGEEAFQQMYDCLMKGNRWADTAAVMLLSLARKNLTSNGEANRHAMHDVGAANTSLLLQAASMDIYGHMMGGFSMQKTIGAFHIPEDMEVVCFIALGYLDDPDKLEEPFRTREITPRNRKPLNAFSFAGELPG